MRHVVLCNVVVLGVAQAAMGVDVVALRSGSGPNYSLEAQGFNGRIVFASGSLSNFPLGSSFDPQGVTGNGSTLWMSSYDSFAGVTRIGSVSLSGTTSSVLQFSTPISDIAYTNGGLYGVVNQPDKLEIVRIAPDGVLTPVYSAAAPTPVVGPGSSLAGRWRLSGVVEGKTLSAYYAGGTFGGPDNTPRDVYNIDAGTGVLQGTFVLNRPGSTALPRGAVLDTVVNRAGNQLRTIGSEQSLFDYPSGTFINVVPAGDPGFVARSLTSDGSVSDEFATAYPATRDAVAELRLMGTLPENGRLIRTPRVIEQQFGVNLINGLAPDDTVLSDVSLGTVLRQVSEPTPMTIESMPSAPGPFMARSLGTATARLDLTSAGRGIYGLALAPLTATYTTDGQVTPNRSVTLRSGGSAGFAYDPISRNVVGNGDFSLSTYGWSGGFYSISGGVPAFGGTSTQSHPMEISQVLELPMPEVVSELSFRARADPGLNATADQYWLRALLHGVVVAEVPLLSEGFTTYIALINRPELFGRRGVELTFEGFTTSSSISGRIYITSVYLGVIPGDYNEDGIVDSADSPFGPTRSERLMPQRMETWMGS